jgi:hypothetical protein
MPNTMIARGSFPTRKAADQAVQRLVSSGFARNSIDLERHDDDGGYDLMVHTRRENLDRVEHLIHTSPSAYNIRSFASGAVQTAKAHPLVLLGTGTDPNPNPPLATPAPVAAPDRGGRRPSAASENLRQDEGRFRHPASARCLSLTLNEA